MKCVVIVCCLVAAAAFGANARDTTSAKKADAPPSGYIIGGEARQAMSLIQLNGDNAGLCGLGDAEVWAEDPIVVAHVAGLNAVTPLFPNWARQGGARAYAHPGDSASDTERRQSSAVDRTMTGGYNTHQPGTFGSRTVGGYSAGDPAFARNRHDVYADKDLRLQAYDAFDAGDYSKALPLFQSNWDRFQYADQAFMIGKMYLTGRGVTRNVPEAIGWLARAVDARAAPQDFYPANPCALGIQADAALTLAALYLDGRDMPKDPDEAGKWYRAADKIGYVPAAHALGRAYMAGYFGEPDIRKAIAYFEKAARRGFTPSQYLLGRLYGDGEETVPDDPKQSRRWLIAAASGGHPDALYEVGRMCDEGDTLPQDSQKAIVYYKDAALKGQAEAQNALGTYFYTGEIVEKNLATARQWFELAAKQGQPDAMFNLAAMLMRGEGGEKDLVVAYIWFRLAEQSGHDKAGAAAKALEAQMTPAERAKAEAVLNPPA